MDKRSTSGYYFVVGGNIVTWRGKKQSIIARSSVKDELRAAIHNICELLWLKKLLEDLRIPNEKPMKFYCDNKTTIDIAHNLVQHDRTKHVEVNRHFIKENLETRLICMPYVPTEEQLAYVLIKGLHKRDVYLLN